jgi:hypothetical protein
VVVALGSTLALTVETMFFPIEPLLSVTHGFSTQYLALFAHEYGHHVQYVTGLLNAATELGNEVRRDPGLARRSVARGVPGRTLHADARHHHDPDRLGT